jgi:hypothetical protein
MNSPPDEALREARAASAKWMGLRPRAWLTGAALVDAFTACYLAALSHPSPPQKEETL